MSYLIGERINDDVKLPILEVRIDANRIFPYRNVFPLLHKHEEVEFIYVVKNKLHIQTTISEMIIKEGEGLFIPKNKLHVLNTFNNCECIAFIFDDQLLAPLCYKSMYLDVIKVTDNPLLDVIHIKDQFVIEMLSKLSIELKLKNEHMILSILHTLWASFLKSFNLDELVGSSIASNKSVILMAYLDYIHLSYSNNISITDIANAGFTSVSECNRIFKTTLQVTAYEYLIKYRINKSLSYLKENHTISEIAHLVGYNSSSQFTKYFRKHMQMTPSVYRKM